MAGPLSADGVRKVLQLRRAGMPVAKIAAQMGVNESTIVRRCKVLKIERRLLDGDEARRLRAAGHALSDISERLGFSLCAVSRACRGVVCPVDHSTQESAKEIFQKQRDRALLVMRGRREKARNWRARGYTNVAIAKALGVVHEQIGKYCAGVKRGPLIRGDVPDELTGNPPKVKNIPVPRWAVLADLGQDYRDLSRAFGEHYAARECRRLKAEAMRPC